MWFSTVVFWLMKEKERKKKKITKNSLPMLITSKFIQVLSTQQGEATCYQNKRHFTIFIRFETVK
jgi:hypothetical protein